MKEAVKGGLVMETLAAGQGKGKGDGEGMAVRARASKRDGYGEGGTRRKPEAMAMARVLQKPCEFCVLLVKQQGKMQLASATHTHT